MALTMQRAAPGVQLARAPGRCAAPAGGLHARAVPLLRAPVRMAARRVAGPALPLRPARAAAVRALAVARPQLQQPAAPAASSAAAPAEPKQQQQRPLRDAFGRILKGAVAAAVAVALIFGNVQPAEAARSAGRVGGFAGDSGASTSRSYGGGGGYSSGGGGYGAGSRFSGAYSSSRYYSPNYGGSYVSPGYPGRYYGQPAITLAPPPVVVSPYPVAPAVGVAVAGPDAFDAILLAGLAFIAFSTVTSALAPGRVGGLLDGAAGAGGGLAVTKLQVGLLAVGRHIKSDLDAIAESADTATNDGLKALLGDVAMELLRNPQYCAYAGAARREVGSSRDLEAAFNAASLAERSKFSRETLVNVRGGGGPRRAALGAAAAAEAANESDELVVVTLLVASKGALELPKKIDSVDQLRSALRALAALPKDRVLGVEVAWTPQADGDVFSRDDLMRDYPDLRML